MLTIHPHDLAPSAAAAAAKTHGLGLIADALQATLVRRVNGDRCLRLTAPWTEKNANLLIADRLICYEGQFYRIAIPARRERAGRRTISLEAPHVMYDLEHSFIVNIETAEDPATVDGINAAHALRQVLAGTAFTPGTVDLDEKLEYLDLLEVHRVSALEQIVRNWGGELVPDNWTLHLKKQAGRDNGLSIRVGKNIKGVECTEDISSVVTRLHVLGYQGAHFKDINEGRDYIDSPHIGKYAFVREDYLRLDDEEDPETLLRLGREELAGRDKPRLSIRIDMAKVRGSGSYPWYRDLERVDEGDTVTVHHEFLGENIKVRAMEVEEDCLTGDILTVTLGEVDTQGLFQGFSSFVKTREMVRKILDHDGYVRARTLRGEIDLLTTRLIASGSYEKAEVIEGKGALLENTDKASPDYGALYIGPGILAIADSKTPSGSWEWRTFGTGKGFVGSEILAHSIHGTKIMAHTIGVEQLHPQIISEVVNNATGQQLVMELSHGAILDAENTQTVARLRVYHNGVEITERIPDGSVRWERVSDDAAGDAAFNADPAHNATKVITVTAQDIDFRGVLRCVMDEARLYAVPSMEDGSWLMTDFGSGDADYFSLDADGMICYEGPNDYSIDSEGMLTVAMDIGAGQVDTQLSNLHTSYMSLTRKGLELYGAGFLRLLSGSKLLMRAGSDMEIQAGAGFDLVAGAGNNYMRLTNTDPDVRLLVGGETKEAAPFWVTPTGEVRATKLQLNNTNITDFTAMLPYGTEGNADPNKPIVMRCMVPSECTGVQSLKVSFLREPFRADSTGAASGGGQTKTSTDGGGWTGTSGAIGILQTNNTALITSNPSIDRTGGASVTYTGNSMGDQMHNHTLAHNHTFAHTHDISNHNHTIPSHSHSVKVPEHAHDVTIDPHTHDIVYGIYEGPTATSCNVYVDGNFVGNYGNLMAFDITQWLSKTSGVINRDHWHVVSIYPNGLTRIVAQAFLIALIGRANNAIY